MSCRNGGVKAGGSVVLVAVVVSGSVQPRSVLQAGAHVRMMRSSARACSKECLETSRIVSPPAGVSPSSLTFALQTELGIFACSSPAHQGAQRTGA